MSRPSVGPTAAQLHYQREHPLGIFIRRIRTSEVLIETDREDDAIVYVSGHNLGLKRMPDLEEQPPFPSDRIDPADHEG